MVWDINTKFSPVSVLIRFQLFTKFERHSLKNEAAMPLTIKNFSRAWQGHFLSQALQTWQICFFFVDVQMILLSYLDTSDCLEIEKNEKAFLSRYSELFGLAYVLHSLEPLLFLSLWVFLLQPTQLGNQGTADITAKRWRIFRIFESRIYIASTRYTNRSCQTSRSIFWIWFEYQLLFKDTIKFCSWMY